MSEAEALSAFNVTSDGLSHSVHFMVLAPLYDKIQDFDIEGPYILAIVSNTLVDFRFCCCFTMLI